MNAQVCFHSALLLAMGEPVVLPLVYFLAGLLPLCGAVYFIYFILTLPMRRNERARLFLFALELGLKDGQTPEAAIMDASSSRDNSLGARFHLLAAYLEKGMNLGEALRKVPRLLPPPVVAMLNSGERIGDITKVLPACRRLLHDGTSQVRGALNYLILLVFAITPFALAVPIVISVFVFPKFREIFSAMSASHLPAFTQFVFSRGSAFVCSQAIILGVIWLATIAYIGGPRVQGWLRRILPGVPDSIQFRLPWRRKRLQRDFSAMLAVLLDAEVPEADAVRLAAESTANETVRKRAAKVCALLNNGVKLPVAIRAIDDSGELQWRLDNALRQGRGFLCALTGWQDALDAKAFQLEQAAAQVATSALVLFNGLIVACIVIAVYLALIHLLNEAVLW